MKVTLDFPDQFLIDQVDSADIRYWANKLHYKPDARLPHAVDEVLEEEEDEEGNPVIVLRPLNWQGAIQVAIKEYPNLLDENRMDAGTGDEWIQLAAFGELKYG